MPAHLQAVVFDFDGVIADTEALHLGAYQETLRTLGLAPGREEYYARYVGLDDEGVIGALASDRGFRLSSHAVRRLVAAKAHCYRRSLAGTSPLMPGAAACLRRIASAVPIGIASGALRVEIDTVLNRAGLGDLVSVIVAAGDVSAGKPAPDPFVRALALLEARRLASAPVGPGAGDAALAAGRSAAVEDSHRGLAAARAAGLRTVAVAGTYPASELRDADLVVEHLDELTVARLDALVAGSR